MALPRSMAFTCLAAPPDAPRTSTIAFTVAGVASSEVCALPSERGVFVSHGNFYAATVVERLGLGGEGLVCAGSRATRHLTKSIVLLRVCGTCMLVRQAAAYLLFPGYQPPCRARRRRSVSLRIFLRRRIFVGVTSSSSSSSMYSSAISSDMIARRLQQDVLVGAGLARMLVSFFSFVGLTAMSSSRAFSPTIMPS